MELLSSLFHSPPSLPVFCPSVLRAHFHLEDCVLSVPLLRTLFLHVWWLTRFHHSGVQMHTSLERLPHAPLQLLISASLQMQAQASSISLTWGLVGNADPTPDLLLQEL